METLETVRFVALYPQQSRLRRRLPAAVLAVACLYLALALALAGARPLWLDEILQLTDTRQGSTAELLRRLPHHTGSAPLGYLVQHATLKLTGYSVFWARFPEAMFASAAVFLVGVLAAQLGLRRPWLAAAAFAALPLTLRYATEGRMYSQGQFFAVLATVLYVRLTARPGFSRAALYGLALAGAVYAQPYAASVAPAHLLWSLLARERRAALFGAAAAAAAGLAFLPWYLACRTGWTAGIAQGHLQFSASAKTPLMFLRELTGAGYGGTAALLLLCAVTLLGGLLAPRAQTLLALLAAVPIAVVFATDAWFDYFVAARQFLWILPALTICAAAAVDRGTRATFVLSTVLAALCSWHGVRLFLAPHENWEAAARVLSQLARQGVCIAVAPPEQAGLYEFFAPDLRHAGCRGPTMVLAITPYAAARDETKARAGLLLEGYRPQHRESIGRSTLVAFRRTAATATK